MKDLTKYYIDLSKCSEEQQKHIRTKIFNSKFPVATLTRHILENMMKHRIKETPYILINEFDHWKLNENHEGKTELTYREFIKPFEGVSEESQTFTKEDMEKAYRAGENKQTYYFKDTTVILPTTYEGVDG